MNALAVAPIADEVGVMQATGLTTYCGLVYPWHCDHMGHMNVMWYTGKFDEASWALLARFGMTDTVRGAPTKIEGQLGWSGSPADFDYPSLHGSLKLTSGSGQFLKADPGMGRLLGVLSLQALPRRVTLDFRDVFSEGFAFDTIAGVGAIANGVISTDNLRLAGPAATVDISGSVDLAQETERLRVKVQPALSSTFSAGAAAPRSGARRSSLKATACPAYACRSDAASATARPRLRAARK